MKRAEQPARGAKGQRQRATPVATVPTLYLLCGLPGSGKTTWRRRSRLRTVVSTDAIRRLIHGQDYNVAYEPAVWAVAYRILEAHLANGVAQVVFDATNLTPARRAPLIAMGKAHGYQVVAVVVATSLDECLRRNVYRRKPVDPEVLRVMAAQWQPPRLDEGFAKLLRVRADF